MYLINHREDFNHLIKSYRSLRLLVEISSIEESSNNGDHNQNNNANNSSSGQANKEWIQKYIMGILSGDNNPKIFLNMIKDKLREIEKNQEDKKFQITVNRQSILVNSKKVQQIIMS